MAERAFVVIKNKKQTISPSSEGECPKGEGVKTNSKNQKQNIRIAYNGYCAELKTDVDYYSEGI